MSTSDSKENLADWCRVDTENEESFEASYQSPRPASAMAALSQPEEHKKDDSLSDDGSHEMQGRTMVAKFDYDPRKNSPNDDGVETDLSFKKDAIITIYREMDEDGFYDGELKGKRGLVPANYMKLHCLKHDDMVKLFALDSKERADESENEKEIIRMAQKIHSLEKEVNEKDLKVIKLEQEMNKTNEPTEQEDPENKNSNKEEFVNLEEKEEQKEKHDKEAPGQPGSKMEEMYIIFFVLMLGIIFGYGMGVKVAEGMPAPRNIAKLKLNPWMEAEINGLEETFAKIHNTSAQLFQKMMKLETSPDRRNVNMDIHGMVEVYLNVSKKLEDCVLENKKTVEDYLEQKGTF